MEKSSIKIDKSILHRLTRASVWSFSGTAMAKFLSLLAGIVCANILTKEQYGQLGIVRSTVNMFVIFGSAGLGVTATRYISYYLKDAKERIPPIYRKSSLISVCAGIIFSLAILLSANVIATDIMNEPSIAPAIRIGSVLLFFSVLNGLQNGALMGFEDFKNIALNNLFGSVFEFVLMVLGAYFYGVEGAILGFGMGFIVIYICNRVSINKNFRKHGIDSLSNRVNNKSDKRIYLNYTIPAALSAIVITPVYWAIRTILVENCGFEELATYEAADQLKVIILYVPMALSQIALPMLSSMMSDKESYRKTLLLNILIVGMFSMAMTVAIMICGGMLMSLYGEEYSDTLTLTLLACSTIFSSVANVLEMSLYSREKMWQCLFINIMWGMVAVSVAYYLVKIEQMGAPGVSYSILISYIFSSIAFLIYSMSILRRGSKVQTDDE